MSELEELLKSRTLFEKKYVVVCDRTLGIPEAKKFVSDNVEKFASSPCVFIFFEESVEEEVLELFHKRAEKITEFNLKPEKPEERRNLFPLCDAFAERNKIAAWTLFQQLILAGATAEEIFWKLWWQVKNLLLVKLLSEAGEKNLLKESGLHSFVIKKTLFALKNFTDKDLFDYSSKLIGLYHGAKNGNAEFEIGVEKFLLNL